ncbi:pirin family protein [Kribbella deserti]|uniref:Pirin family protein n=1 Tax=Kribbella deserti TaxID=1926257 RepID=A0ABV6QH47_9ACTN
MSNIETDPAESACGAEAVETALEFLEPRKVVLGRSTEVRRLLPNKTRRMIGAWCFVDHYGPDDLTARVDSYDAPGATGMLVPPHPHTGLQTVSWLFEGEIEHRDSVGSHAIVRPGELNIMTSGNGIAHSEVSVPDGPATLHGAQLWVALPDEARTTVPPAFAQYVDLPVARFDGARATVLLGTVAGVTSPAPSYTPLVGADLTIDPGQALALPLTPEYEYGVLVVAGRLRIGELTAAHGEMVYLGAGRSSVALADDLSMEIEGSRCLLLGGAPFEERLVMWWNFIGRSHADIVAARADWQASIDAGGNDRFAKVPGYPGDPLPAPGLPATELKPRGRSR